MLTVHYSHACCIGYTQQDSIIRILTCVEVEFVMTLCLQRPKCNAVRAGRQFATLRPSKGW
jgi:hypothetical protein